MLNYVFIRRLVNIWVNKTDHFRMIDDVTDSGFVVPNIRDRLQRMLLLRLNPEKMRLVQ